MNFLQGLILLMSVLNFIFAFILYLHSRKSIAETFFALVAFNVGLWSAAIFLLTSPNISFHYFKLGAISHFWAGNLIFLAFFWFAVFYKAQAVSLTWPIFVSLIDVVFLLLIAFSRFIFLEISQTGRLSDSFVFNTGGYVIYSVFLLCFFIAAELVMFKRYRKSIGLERKQLGYVILATFIAGLLGQTTNLILPGFGVFEIFALGPVLSTIFIGLIGYAILKHGLFNLRIIAAEIFTALLVLATIVNLFTATTGFSAAGQGLILIISVVFGYFLIRSVYQEIRSREKIEQLAKDLEAANEELKKLDEAKSEFISLAGHQLRAPLTVIKGYASMLREGSFGEFNQKAAEALDRVFLSANNLTKLVSELLDLSRIEAGRLKYDFKKIYLDDVIEAVIRELTEVSKAKRIDIQFKNENNKTFSVFGDPAKLHEVVINLLDNALKYSKISPVVVTLKPRSKRLAFSVADRGLGIPANEISKLFQKFGRTEMAKKEQPDGMGLGLYFIKKIVDDHKGRIWAESGGIGEGSTFFVELPVA